MANIGDFIDPAAIRPEMEAETKQEVLQELTALLFASHESLGQHLTRAEAFTMLDDREKLAATGVGNGVAIPHAASPKLKNLYGGFSRSSRGIDFGAIDGQPCHLFFVLLCPSALPKIRIKALSRISRLLGDDRNRDALLAAETAEEIYAILVSADEATAQQPKA